MSETKRWPTVLIVDDEPQQSLLTGRIVLDVWPTAEIHTVSSAGEGLKQAEALRPHLVLTDIRMPGTDGVELCRRIKQDPFMARTIKVIAMTGYDDPMVRSEALGFGADAYLTKPVEVDTWRKSLNRVLPGPGMQKKNGWTWEG